MALGVGVAFFGYSLLYYGITQIQGGNWGYLDLIVPNRWNSQIAKTPKDAAAK
jgi:hypothetical protein